MSNFTANTDYLKTLFLQDTPFLDVRAPVEFERGSFPTASNIPLLNDQQREEIGRCYKRNGKDAAVALGYACISGQTKQQRLDAWHLFLEKNPTAHLFCWRGGMRSQLTQHAIKAQGFDIPLVTGGYKALRHVLQEQLQVMPINREFIIIGGKTGTAKTLLIKQLSSGVDLEGLACHRGSSFGRGVIQPPNQVNFEHSLAIDLIKKQYSGSNSPLFLEDESRNIGPLVIPPAIWQAMLSSSLVIVEMPIEYRVQHVIQEYVVEMSAQCLAVDAVNGFDFYRNHLLAGLERIQRRLGGLRYRELETLLRAAIDQQERSGSVLLFEGCVRILLEQYYDPMYDYQLQKKRSRSLFTGDYYQVKAWAEARMASSL